MVQEWYRNGTGTVQERYNAAPIPVLLIKGTVIERYRNSINTVPVLFITVRLPVLFKGPVMDRYFYKGTVMGR